MGARGAGSMLSNHRDRELRTDIQALRGIAVSLVVVYHGGLLPLRAGWLGVDVFFVVSGYLITGLIGRQLEAGTFSFASFYWRRAKRLLPAAYVTLSWTTMGCLLHLTAFELLSYAWQLVGALTFTTNVVLARQAGYFDAAAELKPLLHFWSLAIEEQFYLLLPVLLFFSPKRFRLPVVLGLLVASLGLWLTLSVSQPQTAFYLLPTRAWELLLGSAGALWGRVAWVERWQGALGAGALAAMLICGAWPFEPLMPRVQVLVMCVATLVALQTRPRRLGAGPGARTLAGVGDISYSLYLVHWPILVFGRYAYLGPVPYTVRLSCVTLAVVLGAALYRFVERPWHYGGPVAPPRRFAGALALTSLVMIALPWSMLAFGRAAEWRELRRANYGLSSTCDYRADYKPRPECQNGAHPQLAIWGDSFAMHLVPGLAASGQGSGIVQITKSVCGPMTGVVADAAQPETQRCLAFNRGALAHLQDAKDVRIVVVASLFNALGYGKERARDGFVNTITALREAGKKVVVVAPPPSARFNMGQCVERLLARLVTLDLPPDCAFSLADERERHKDLVELLGEVSRNAEVEVIWPSDILCHDGLCRTHEGGLPLYRDEGHLSMVGSLAYAREARLYERIIALAR